MLPKTEQLNHLFEGWVPDYGDKFVKDGIIDEQKFEKALQKVLFITKEPNDNDKASNTDLSGRDFRVWWKDGVAFRFSLSIAEWSYGLLNNFPEFDEILQGTRRHDSILQIAFMNIKKVGGGSISDCSTMMNYVKLNFNSLHKQIEIISPEIIITGLSWPKLRNALFPSVEWKKSGYDKVMIGKFNNIKIIDFYHPSSRSAPAASYSLLQNIVNNDKFKSL